MLLLVLLAIGLFYSGLLGCLYAAQRSLIFPAPPLLASPVPAGVRELQLGTAAVPVFARFLPPPEGARVVVHFHANAEVLPDLDSLLEGYRRAGLGFAAVEYPGYGLAAAQAPSEASLQSAAETLLAYLESVEHLGRERLVLEGRSLGTGVATEMARRGHGSRLILMSPYTSLPAVAQEMLPFVPARLLMRDRFPTDERAPSVAIPVLIVHGTDDEVIPFHMGEALTHRFPQVQLRRIEHGHHNDLFQSDPDLMAALIAFARG